MRLAPGATWSAHARWRTRSGRKPKAPGRTCRPWATRPWLPRARARRPRGRELARRRPSARTAAFPGPSIRSGPAVHPVAAAGEHQLQLVQHPDLVRGAFVIGLRTLVGLRELLPDDLGLVHGIPFLVAEGPCGAS